MKKRKKKGTTRGAPRGTTHGRKSGESVTIEHALGLAMQLHQSAVRTKTQQAFAEARLLYERILEAMPSHAEALHYLGVLRHQTGDGERAVELIRRSIEASPERADFLNNLGNVLKERERLSEAAEAYRSAIALTPDHADAHSNLGTVLKASGDVEGAVVAYERALELAPEHASAHHNLANALQRLGRREEAIAHYRHAVALDPNHPDARKLLGLALYYSGHVAEAIDVVRTWQKLDPTNPVAPHMLAAFSGSDVPSRASDAYVTRAFDAMSATFDEHLKDLGYRAPELVAAAVSTYCGPPSGALEVLDAGCGTGLCGPSLRPYAKHLVGVDLSSGMLERAHGGGSYDELAQAELTAFLEARPDSSDLIVSADTLCYFGDLGAVLAASSRALRTGGHLVFTVEEIAEDEAAGFRLNPHGRYSHAASYVRAAIAAAGMSVVEVRGDVLRHERDEPVAGLVVVARC